MTRIYAGVGAEELRLLAEGESVTVVAVVPASDDEQDEFDATVEAAAGSRVVLVAEVERPEDPVDLSLVESFHVDMDGSGDLAWFATQELDQVIALVDADS